MVAKSSVETIHQHLFAEQDSQVYVVLDGPGLRPLTRTFRVPVGAGAALPRVSSPSSCK